MDQFAWSKAEALYYMGILMSVGAVIACITFVGINPLCKIFPEAKVMLWGGFLFMVLGRAVYIPWGNTTPQMYDDSIKYNTSVNTSICSSIHKHDISAMFRLNTSNYDNLNLTFPIGSNFTNTSMLNNTNEYNLNYPKKLCNNEELVGCPSSQEWCNYTPAMTIFQFLLGYVLTCLGYPVGVTLIQTIFSKILGPRPQVRKNTRL